LVYARGFGYAEVETRATVQPASLFRLASLSKPVTAIAVLKQVDAGRLNLDDCVIDLLPHRPHGAGAPVDGRWSRVTVRHLLQHRGGWDRTQSFDPMFRSVEIARVLGVASPARPDDVVSYMLGRDLDFAPGERYAYSNFGYCLLGRLLEQVSGRDYESLVRRTVLEPMGIRGMRIGATLAGERAAGEVRYYGPPGGTGPAVVGPGVGQQVPLPYGAWYLEGMDAHGGWLASASDMVRFASQVQCWSTTGVLSATAYEAMIARPAGAQDADAAEPAGAAYYGLGWDVRRVRGGYNLWHMGALAGTSTLLVQRHDGLCWAVLFNGSATADGSRPAAKIDSLVHRAVDAVRRWPDHDLFTADDRTLSTEQ
jgi:N-acyl-D-amino-acid deacylase